MLDLDYRLRPKERFFTKPLLTGLAIALIFHLIAFFLFDISLATPPNFLPQLPTLATADLPNTPKTITVSTPSLFTPPLSTPMLQSPPLPTATTECETPIPQHQIDYTPTALAFAYPYSPLTLHISGNLAGRAVTHNPTPTSRLLAYNTQTSAITFRVILDEKKGQIFYMEPQVTTGSPNLEQAKSLIADLRFEPKPDAIMTEGIVEVTFTEEVQND